MASISNFISLLPYNPEALITDNDFKLRLLNLMKFLLSSFHEALREFYLKKNLLSFDAHVGENLCQIRACYLLEALCGMSSSVSGKQVSDRVNKLKKILLTIESEIARVKVEMIMPTHLHKRTVEIWDNISTYLNNNCINIDVTELDVFLLTSLLLTRYRKINREENMVINYELLKKAIPASKNLCRRLVHDYQKILSEISSEYVLSLAQNSISKQLLNLLCHLDDDGRKVLPCYSVMRYLFTQLKCQQLPILLLIRHKHEKSALLFLQFKSVNGKYKLYEQTPENSSKPCLIVYGLTEQPLDSVQNRKRYMAIYNSCSLEDVLMGSMAVHPQYSGKKLRALRFNPYTPLLACIKSDIVNQARLIEKSYFYHKSTAIDLGCCVDRPLFLNIRHIAAGYTMDRDYYCSYSPEQLIETKEEYCLA